MKFYALSIPDHHASQVWCVEQNTAYRVGGGIDPKRSKNCFLNVDPNSSLEQQFERAFQIWRGLKLHRLKLKPGQYFARMARPVHQHPQDHGRFPIHGLYIDEISGALGQLISLEARLDNICQVIEPSPKNMDAFGHSIRECLLIASMEVESHWKNILRANGNTRDKLTTADYFTVAAPLKLEDYEVAFNRFPAVGNVRPFSNWSSTSPTKSLDFYDAYNAVKHDRERAFERGTLRLVFKAIAACLIMTVAQFGYAEVFPKNRSIVEAFRIVKKPNWSPEECYAVANTDWPAEEVRFGF